MEIASFKQENNKNYKKYTLLSFDWLIKKLIGRNAGMYTFSRNSSSFPYIRKMLVQWAKYLSENFSFLWSQIQKRWHFFHFHVFPSPACFLNRCYLHLSTITSFFSQMSVAWRPESFSPVARDFPQKNPLNSQKVAQKLLKESQKFLFVAKVAQKLFKKIVPWFVRTVCCR